MEINEQVTTEQGTEQAKPKTNVEKLAEHDALAKAKAAELTKREGVKVTPILFYENGNADDPVYGYLKAPTRVAKVAIMDKSEQSGNYSAGAEMLTFCLLKAESDPRLTSEAPEHDDIYMGAVLACQDLIKASVNQIKKN
jgi:hypothetical protein